MTARVPERASSGALAARSADCSFPSRRPPRITPASVLGLGTSFSMHQPIRLYKRVSARVQTRDPNPPMAPS